VERADGGNSTRPGAVHFSVHWSIKITGPDADDLMWLDLSHPEKDR
jgi:hypothetical protein